jgi:hypothetical protein
MEWMLRLVGTGIDGQSQSSDVMAISRPDALGDLANLGLTLVEARQEVRAGNVETVDGGRQVFGAITRAETDITALVQRTLKTIGRTDATEVTAFTDGRPGLRAFLADAA